MKLALEISFAAVEKSHQVYAERIDSVIFKYTTDYQQFVQDRKRWKGDFDNATLRAKQAIKETD